jgi:hypothetical protein
MGGATLANIHMDSSIYEGRENKKHFYSFLINIFNFFSRKMWGLNHD